MDRADPSPRAPALLAVEVIYCPRPGAVDSVALRLPAGSTLAQALAASGLLGRHGLQLEGLPVGVWCRAQPLSTLLRDRDRVEIYRPLTVDPKESRRQRYHLHKKTQKARLQSAGTSSQ